MEKISQYNHDALGADGWEISAHYASAPDHAPIQGRQYTDEAFSRLNGSLRRRIGTLNCGHNAFPVLLGVSTPQHSRSELERMRRENEKGVDYEGRHFATVYDATQYQRRIERAIRAQKRRQWVEDTKERRSKLNILETEYIRFCKAVGLRTERERLNVFRGSGWNVRRAKVVRKIAEKVAFARNVPETIRTSIENEIKQIPERARKIAEGYITQITVISSDSSGYNTRTGELFLSENRDHGSVIHEYAHAIEKALRLYDDPEFLSIRDRGLENLTLADIIEDEENFARPIFRVHSEKLISLYQGRLYERYGIYDGEHISLDGMREYFSEGFRVYVTDPERLKEKDPDLFRYIGRMFE